jgi:hypothetical protein
MTVDVSMQHLTQRLLRNDMFASLRRWMGEAMLSDEVPLEVTLASMDAAVSRSDCSARGWALTGLT